MALTVAMHDFERHSIAMDFIAQYTVDNAIIIFVANLQVGLAVDDIKGILETAVLTRLALRVK